MVTDVAHVTVLVEDVDEAMEWDTGRFGSEGRADEARRAVEDTSLRPPPGEDRSAFLR